MADPHDHDLPVGRDGHPGRRPGDDEPAAANSWPAGWPRLYPERAAGDGLAERGPAKATQRVSFVGGSADGLTDLVAEATPGRLPANVETMGSVYRLVETSWGELRYQWHGFEDN